MTDVFISYSSKDEVFARQLYEAINALGVKTFLASVSLEPGSKWSQDILSNLEKAKWVFFLASQEACRSQAVNQELGAALITRKEIIPVVWDISPEQLPAWIKERQAIDIGSGNTDNLRQAIADIAEKVKWGQVITGALLGVLVGVGVAMLFSKK